ncbi:hypothetical protein OHO28_39125 [Streptomyces europaeiscabiei]|uniref:hypothetical protein n=1 Tax=Streptomyces europaeiscabiei TaxID=146819 RepID=UPI002E187F34
MSLGPRPAVEKTVVQHRALLRGPHDSAATPISAVMKTMGLEPHSAPGPRTAGRLSDRIREQHATVHALLGKGVGLRAIGRDLGPARNNEVTAGEPGPLRNP